MIEIAREPVEAPQSAPRAKFGRASDNALARAIGRIPLPLGAKLLIGFALVGALLALVAVLGLLALGHSNSRSTELRRLKQQGVYEQLLLTDATQLKQLVHYRADHGSNSRPSRGDERNLRHYDPDSYERGFFSLADQQIGNEYDQLCKDAGVCGANGTETCVVDPNTGLCRPSRNPRTLEAVSPSLARKLEEIDARPGGPAFLAACAPDSPLFLCIAASSGTQQGPVEPLVRAAVHWADVFAASLDVLTRKTQTRADALVAADRRSYSRSRNLLIGVGVASLLLAVALGLLLASSVVAPLRRTESRLDEIAVGDFADRLEVANRDEIGSLAAKVNRTSDELQRVHRELELASERKSQYVTNMSHELRTPLNAIIGFSEVLHEQMFGELNERQLAYVDDIREAGKHQLSLVNDLLDLAKIEAGRMDLELSQVAIPDLLRSAVSLNAERARRGGVELEWTSEPEEIMVTADERRTRQVVLNLVSNAIKFTPSEGRIDLSAQLQDGQVEVAVADTGPGISAQDLESIFEEFEQTAAGKQVEGTGLGLALSRKLVELHGGRLWAESEPGQGSTFRFTLPLEAAE